MPSKIGLGGSCHWCTEAIFSSLIGVSVVEQGWITSKEYNAESEAIIVQYDESIISTEILIEIHLYTHSSSSNHPMRGKYRSAVYVYDEDQYSIVNNILIQQRTISEKKLITEALMINSFRLNQEKYLDYYFRNPTKPFCENYITPKLKLLLNRYSSNVDSTKLGPTMDKIDYDPF